MERFHNCSSGYSYFHFKLAAALTLFNYAIKVLFGSFSLETNGAFGCGSARIRTSPNVLLRSSNFEGQHWDSFVPTPHPEPNNII